MGTGASLQVLLSVGTHVITADVTDSGGLSASDAITITVTETGFTLSVNGYKVKGKWTTDLMWSGSSATSFDIYRTDLGAPLATGVTGNTYTDSTSFKGSGSLTYQVYEAGSTTVCTNLATASF